MTILVYLPGQGPVVHVAISVELPFKSEHGLPQSCVGSKHGRVLVLVPLPSQLIEQADQSDQPSHLALMSEESMS